MQKRRVVWENVGRGNQCLQCPNVRFHLDTQLCIDWGGHVQVWGWPSVSSLAKSNELGCVTNKADKFMYAKPPSKSAPLPFPISRMSIVVAPLFTTPLFFTFGVLQVKMAQGGELRNGEWFSLGPGSTRGKLIAFSFYAWMYIGLFTDVPLVDAHEKMRGKIVREDFIVLQFYNPSMWPFLPF